MMSAPGVWQTGAEMGSSSGDAMVIAQQARETQQVITEVVGGTGRAGQSGTILLILLVATAIVALMARSRKGAAQDQPRQRLLRRASVGAVAVLAMVLVLGVVGINVGLLWERANELFVAPLVLAGVAAVAYRLGQLDARRDGGLAPRESHDVPDDVTPSAP